ncbi:2,4-dihydroxyhept-2-ene-1,7-dioic acid aldolase [Desulfovibrio sp. OttesenSCG-928-O18]|nr:2,4-dihydroxyhept-2-ene-1,7-dioic acid aldolase [Desulfovibrio sp. OttesenSCG-928-O18]
MRWIREQVLKREFCAGMWCSLASSIPAEIIGQTGYDWVLLDQEHSPATGFSLLGQLQALAPSATAPIIRLAQLDWAAAKSALDLGASGLMFPNIDSVETAATAASYLRYPPRGLRGVGGSVRATAYGRDFETYFKTAGDNLLGVMQIETAKGVDAIEAIAAVDGVDVLFVGPMDLSTSLQMPDRFKDERFVKVLQRVADAAASAGKASGILLPDTGVLPLVKNMGYTFVAVGQDLVILAKNLRENLQKIREIQAG